MRLSFNIFILFFIALMQLKVKVFVNMLMIHLSFIAILKSKEFWSMKMFIFAYLQQGAFQKIQKLGYQYLRVYTAYIELLWLYDATLIFHWNQFFVVLYLFWLLQISMACMRHVGGHFLLQVTSWIYKLSCFFVEKFIYLVCRNHNHEFNDWKRCGHL